MEISNKKNIVILGGGFAGLRIAYLLNKFDYHVSIIEKNNKMGGMVQTYEYEYEREHFYFDFGPHLFFEDYVKEYRDLLGTDLLSLSNRFCMYTNKATLSYPIRPLEMFTKMNPVTSILYVMDYLINGTKLKLSNEENDSLKTFMTKRFGRKLYDDFYSPYIEKCTGLSSNQISVLWGKERENVSGMSLIENIINKINYLLSSRTREQLTRANSPSANSITGWYPRRGAGQLCDAMTVTLNPKSIYLNSKIELINIKGQSVQDIIMNINGFKKKISGDYYVSTLPLPELIKLFLPTFMNKSEVCPKIGYRSVRLVNLIIYKDRILDCLEIFSMNKRHIFKRIYEPKAMSSFMAPLGKSSLCLEVCYNKGDEIEKMSKTDLVARCIEDLISMKLLKSMDVVKDAFIVEMPNAYPIYNKGFEVERQKLLDIVNGLDNLLTCGRQGLFRYHAMTNEIMEMADRVTGFLEGNRDKRSVDDNNSQWGTFFN